MSTRHMLNSQPVCIHMHTQIYERTKKTRKNTTSDWHYAHQSTHHQE
uniref:Uncharacterized protein n=1 Tax=Arundo donax TaxID=35708 RepID=A0A0A9GKY0_ARUDO